jgi:ATP-dependent helicase YprA (DUF1998 family)
MGTKSPPAEMYALPATIEGLRERIAELTGDLALIWADLADESRRETLSAAQYKHWASKARKAYAHKLAEQKYLKAQLVRHELRRQETTRAAKAARLAARQERNAELQAAMENASAEVKLIRRLYGAVTRLYRDTREPVTERDRELMDTVHAYLVAAGMFDD